MPVQGRIFNNDHVIQSPLFLLVLFRLLDAKENGKALIIYYSLNSVTERVAKQLSQERAAPRHIRSRWTGVTPGRVPM
jgi:hypothetical protein